MNHFDVLRRLTCLPDPMAAHIRTLHLEAVGPMARNFAADLIRRNDEAGCEAFAFGIKNGASGYLQPAQFGGDGRPRWFVFPKPPTFKGWVKTKERRNEGAVYTAGKSREGRILSAEFDKLPPLVRSSEVMEAAGLLDRLSFNKGAYQTEVGREGHRLSFTVFGYTTDRLFVLTPNPFYDVLNIVTADPTLIPDAEVFRWRPAAGWALTSKAAIDLAMAEDRAKKAEALKAALAEKGKS